jgi:hypothetical protein
MNSATTPMTSHNTEGLVQSPCIYEASVAAGVCGDWLSAPSIRGAAISGIQMAEAIVAGVEAPAFSATTAPVKAGKYNSNYGSDAGRGGRRSGGRGNRGGRGGAGRGGVSSAQLPKFAPSPSPPIGSFPGLNVPVGEGWGAP